MLPRTAEFFHRNRRKSDGFHAWCKTCNNESQAEFAAANRDKLRTRHRAYVEANPEKRKETLRKYHATHVEQDTARMREWRKDNPERAKEAERQYREAHRAERCATEHKRRAAKRNSSGIHTAEDTRGQYERQRGCCFYCGSKVGDTFHVDHVIPLSKGGSNGAENIVIACPRCNLKKQAKHPMDFCGRLL